MRLTQVSPSTWQVGMALTRDNTLLTNHLVGFSGMILWWVRIVNEFEVAGKLPSASPLITDTDV